MNFKSLTLKTITHSLVFTLSLASIGLSDNMDHSKHQMEPSAKKESHANHTHSKKLSPKTLNTFLTHYYSIHSSFTDDNYKEVKKKIEKWEKEANDIKGSQAEKDFTKKIAAVLKNISKHTEIKAARDDFSQLSDLMITLVKKNQTEKGQEVYIYHCPMAKKGKGADWLQNKEGTQNPYFGNGMRKCGGKVKSFTI